jgi:hypothetical protein
MVVDSLSLHLISIYLRIFDANEGEVSDIQISKETLDVNVKKSGPRYDTLSDFMDFVKETDDLVNYERINRERISLYKLKSFNITKNESMCTVSNKEDIKYTTKGNISKITMKSLNEKYLSIFDEIHILFHELSMDEYIFTHEDILPGELNPYISYGYIERYFSNGVEELKKLYQKYKNIL